MNSTKNFTRKLGAMETPDFGQVRIFVAAADAGTLTGAARKMNLPPSTLSRSLTRLERQLGVLLVYRNPKGLVLTDAGIEYLQFCKRALRTMQEGADLLESRRSGPRGTIKVSCPVTMAIHLLAPLLKDFVLRFPDLRIELETYSSDYDQEPRDDVDVFFKLLKPKDSFRRLRIYPATVRGLFASPAYIQTFGSPGFPDDLSAHKCIGSEVWKFQRDGTIARPTISFHIRSQNPFVNLAATVDGLGIAILPLWAAEPQQIRKAIVRVLPEWEPEPIRLCALFFGPSKLTPKVKLLLDFFSEYIGTDLDPRIQNLHGKGYFTASTL